MLDAVDAWCRKWIFSPNQGKTKIVHYRPPSFPQSDVIFTCGDFNVAIVSQYKYLGLWLDEHLTLDTAVTELAKSASRALGVLITTCFALGGMDHKMFTSLYQTLLQPILNYGAGLWGTKRQRYIRNVQNNACKFYLGVNGNTSHVAARGDMSWLSSLIQQQVQVCRLWIHLQNHPDDRTCKIVHTWSKHRTGRSWEKVTTQLAIEYDISDKSSSKRNHQTY